MLVLDDSILGYLNEVKTFATVVGQLEQLENKLKYLDTYAEHGQRGMTRTSLWKDFAPYSFEFMVELLQSDGGYIPYLRGGLIFHGKHDQFGSGGAPTYSVCLKPTDGWSIHT